MVVQHNLTAMNSNRMLGITTKSVASSTEKLSSGYKINRAADDAAGLSISEKMRRQIRGLTQASSNAQDGISSVQTAEGALSEVQDMLQRMDELATKAANGTMSEKDRQNVQDEIDQLTTEIDRISETTKFNETYLLKGSTNEADGVYRKNLNAKSAGINGTFTTTDATILNADTKSTITTVTFALTAEEVEKINGLKAGDTYDIGGVVYSIVQDGALVGDASDNQIAESKVLDEDEGLYAKMTAALNKANEIGTISDNETSHAGSAVTKDTDWEGGKVSWTITKANVSVQSPLSLSLHVGADSLANNKIDLQIEKLNSRGLGV
ncbi:MAG: flagellar hook protein, partial [Lachnospiraceae bacterium]|nr:flagellar hook protein [Lachnospiraceae bacterium]